MKKTKILFVTTVLCGALTVGLGAFGAHGLKPYLNEYQQGIYEKAVFYQFIHVLAALLALLAAQSFRNKGFETAAVLFLMGIFCFSGSLYGLAVHDWMPIPKFILVPVTPVGGTLFIAGWLLFAYQFTCVSFSNK